jgi:predicted NAD-dependent protein-ADP-ribosyltransferase YbiA (DUF1768 family)
MMAAKARLFQDDAMLEQILSAPDPGIAKALGRQVKTSMMKFGRQMRVI